MSSSARPPLVLLVDPVVASRAWMWRAMSRTFGVLEAASASGAREWIARRPDIDALVVQDDLPDARGADLVSELTQRCHQAATRSIVVSRSSADWRAALAKLALWFFARDAMQSRTLLREADRRMA